MGQEGHHLMYYVKERKELIYVIVRKAYGDLPTISLAMQHTPTSMHTCV